MCTRVRFPLPARACDVEVTPRRGPGAPCTGDQSIFRHIVALAFAYLLIPRAAPEIVLSRATVGCSASLGTPPAQQWQPGDCTQ